MKIGSLAVALACLMATAALAQVETTVMPKPDPARTNAPVFRGPQPAPPPGLLHPMFQDHAVLQRGQPIRIYGNASAGTAVHVALGTAATDATADSRATSRSRSESASVRPSPARVLAALACTRDAQSASSQPRSSAATRCSVPRIGHDRTTSPASSGA